MAESSMPNAVQESLTCSVCLEIFENPQILPCGHSLCGEPRKCMTKILDSQPCCPCCRKDFLQIQGESGMTYLVMPNYSLKDAVEVMKEAQQKKTENQPAHCEVHAKPLDLFCSRCVELICSHCHVENHSDSQHHEVEIYLKFAGKFQEKYLGKLADFQRSGQELQQCSQDITADETQLFKTAEEMKNVIRKFNGNVSRQSFKENRGNIVKMMAESGELIGKLQDNNKLREDSLANLKSDLRAVREEIWKELKVREVRCFPVPMLFDACAVGDKIVCVTLDDQRLISIDRFNGEAVDLRRNEKTAFWKISAFDNATIYALEYHRDGGKRSVACYSLSGSDLTETWRTEIAGWCPEITSNGSNMVVIKDLNGTSIKITLFEKLDSQIQYEVDLYPELKGNLIVLRAQLLQQRILMIICVVVEERGKKPLGVEGICYFFILDLNKRWKKPGFIRRIQLEGRKYEDTPECAIVPSEHRDHWSIVLERNDRLELYEVDIYKLKDGVTISPSACKLSLTEKEIKGTWFIGTVGINAILWQDKYNNTRILKIG